MAKSKKLIVGNWKMNPLTGSEAKKTFSAIREVASKLKKTKTVICPPFIYLENLSKLRSSGISPGAQDVFWELEGAYTGEISPKMLQKLGVEYVIVGHSERRAMGETNEMANRKVKTCIKYGLTPILCVGERVRDEEANYLNFIRQEIKESLAGITKENIKKVVIAYEPVWAIGKNALRQAKAEECLEMSIFIKKNIADIFGAKSAEKVSILYGGSINADNAKNFLAGGGVNGLLVGRESLDAEKFGKILKDAEKN